jgi:serine/threonine protein kinase
MCNNSHLYIVMPYCDGGDLCMRVAQMEHTRLTEDEARLYFKQILKVRSVCRGVIISAAE